ncbi:MAG TPA: hypothetical protein VMU15_05575 [Anaeromyxobacter sp.]|nr:hypothetical protein [Anaeromyxobacter sp.]
MVEDGQALLALAIVVFTALLLIVAAVVALFRSRRTPGLGATSGRAIEEVAAAMLASGLGVTPDLAHGLKRPTQA